MQLTVKQAASFLDVPERQIHAWIDEGEIPFSREQGRIRFNQAELRHRSGRSRVGDPGGRFAPAAGTGRGP